METFLLHFLISSNCVMLNGRHVNNDFTSVSTKGLAVVDYVVVSHQELTRYSNFEVLRARQLFDNAGLLGVRDPDHNIADHSVLGWHYKMEEYIDPAIDQSISPVVKYRYDVSEIPDTFMVDTDLQCEANVIIADINESYADFCSILKSEMETTLPKKRVMTSNAAYKNRHNRFKPWWTPDLSELWESCRNSERNMSAIPLGRDNFLQCQREFDKEVRYAKRQYLQQQQEELLALKNSRDFWKSFGQIGIQSSRKRQISMGGCY